MQTVSVTNNSLTHIFKMFLIMTLKFKLRVKTQTISVALHMLLEVKANTNKSSKNY